MANNSDNLIQQALGLPEDERAALAAALFRSLDHHVDSNADQEWAVEIEKRIAEIDQGAVSLIPWDSVMQEMRNRQDG